MSVLLCLRAGGFSKPAKGASGLGPVGRAVSAMCSAPGASGEAASGQDVIPFPCAGAGVSARIGSIGCAPARGVSARWCWEVQGGVRYPKADCVRQRARWFHRICARSRRQPHTGFAVRVSGRPCASKETGYPHQAREFWRCARQVELTSIRPLASQGPVGSIRVCGAAPSTSTMRCAIQCSSSLRNWRRARHNTQLCSNRLVTEAGLPAEGTAGCMSVLLCWAHRPWVAAGRGFPPGLHRVHLRSFRLVRRTRSTSPCASLGGRLFRQALLGLCDTRPVQAVPSHGASLQK